MTLVWQGRQDSNLRMPGSKSGALGLLATPLRVKPGLGIRALGFAEAKAHAAAVVHESRIPNPESRSSSAPSSGERAAPCAVHARRPAGSRASAARSEEQRLQSSH